MQYESLPHRKRQQEDREKDRHIGLEVDAQAFKARQVQEDSTAQPQNVHRAVIDETPAAPFLHCEATSL